MRTEHFQTLQVSIGETLTAESSEGNALGGYKHCVRLAEDTIARIREELAGDPFPDKTQEIAFYKEDAPWIWGYYLYYSRLVEIEVWRKTRSPERFGELIQKELRRAQVYPEKHRVCEDYYLGATDSDDRHFLRRKTRASGRDKMGMFLDRDMPTGTYDLAWMRAYELLRTWLDDELEAIEYRRLGLERRTKFVCNLEPMQALELLKGLHVVGMFKDWSFKRVICWAEDALGIRIAHHDSLLQDLKRRKIARTEFLDKTKTRLLEYMDRKG